MMQETSGCWFAGIIFLFNLVSNLERGLGSRVGSR